MLNYQSGSVRDALDHIFKKSEFIGKKPMDGVLQGKQDILFFETQQISYLDKDQATEKALVKDADERDKKRVEFLTSTFQINPVPGSKNSIEWLLRMKQAENDEVFMSNLKLLIDYKFNRVFKWLLADLIFHLFYYFLVCLEASSWGRTNIYRWMTLSYTIILLIVEMFQLS